MTWNQNFLRWYGAALPDNYLTFDCETNGLKRDWALPLEIGHCIVRDRKPVHRGHFVLNWDGYPGVETDWLCSTMAQIRKQMGAQGKPYRYDLDYLHQYGKDPTTVLEFYYRLFTKNRAAGAFFVGHNAWSFDSPLLTSVMMESLGVSWVFDENELFDTGGMEKSLLGDIPPFPDDRSLKDFFLRACHAYRKGVKWNIDACIERYDMHNRFELGEAHGAEEDAYVAHLLFEEHRNVAVA